VSAEQRQAIRENTRLLNAPQRLAPEAVGHYVNRCASASLIGASGIGGQYQVGYCDHQWGLAGSTGTVVGLVVKHDHTPTGHAYEDDMPESAPLTVSRRRQQRAYRETLIDIQTTRVLPV
jgi:hypothetical protein